MSKSRPGELYEKSDDEKYYHIETVDETLKDLGSSRKGLSQEEASKRLTQKGLNSIVKVRRFRSLKLFVSKLNSILIYVLAVTAGISYYLDHMLEFWVILGIIGFTVLLGFIQEFRAEKSVEALKKLTAKKVWGIRDDKRVEILAEELVPGDIVLLKRGLIVPADLRIIESNSLSLNESILTGESIPKGKIVQGLKDHNVSIAEMDNIAFSGTSVMNGTGLGVVIRTGFDSEIGKISKSLTDIGDKKTPLQKKIDTMSARISYFVIGLAVIVYFYLLYQGTPTTTALILVAALAVGGIPEGFPLALTLALSSGVRRMAQKNAIIKDMASVETLGTTTVICTDKTGTLTQNKMLAVKVNLNTAHDINVEGKPYEPIDKFYLDGKEVKKDFFKHRAPFFKTLILCNNTHITMVDGSWKLSGEPTEGALLSLAQSAGFDDVVIREENKRLHEVPFDSAKKFMITVNKDKTGDVAYLKGAVEKVLEKCSWIFKEGKKVKLTENDKKEVLKKVHEYTSSSLRVMGAAKKDLAKYKHESQLEKDFIFEGIIGIKDPIRPEVPAAIAECEEAGIRTIMVTGDHKSTAQAIGKELGLVKSKYDLIIEGHELEEMTDEELDEAIDKVVIFARTTPDHKMRIVKSLQRKGEIVAMTGDGVNDAPALKKADIGVSMGLEGTEVAREASNMVLADDAFSTIVNAVREGRTIYSNIRRFTYYLLTINLSEVIIILSAIIFAFVHPLTALMILFINVITGSFPSLGLSVEPTNEKVMSHYPRDPKDKLLSNYLILKILAVVPLLVIGALGVFLWEIYLGTGDVEKARTLAFATIVVFELFHAFNARSMHTSVFSDRFFKNGYFFLGLGFSIVALLISVHTSFGQAVLQTVPLTGLEWLVTIVIGSSVLLTAEIIKMLIHAEIEEQNKLQGKNLSFE